jgi:hypothetical protein
MKAFIRVSNHPRAEILPAEKSAVDSWETVLDGNVKSKRDLLRITEQLGRSYRAVQAFGRKLLIYQVVNGLLFNNRSSLEEDLLQKENSNASNLFAR